MMTSKELIKRRFERGLKTYSKQASVQQLLARELVDELIKYGFAEFNRVLEIGVGTGFLTQHLMQRCEIQEYVLNDLVDPELNKPDVPLDKNKIKKINYLQGDAEHIDFPGLFNGVFSTSTFHWFFNLDAFFQKISKILVPKGILAFTTFGVENYHEIKSALHIGLNYNSTAGMVNMLKEDFDIIARKEWVQKEHFNNPYEVLKHMKETGVNGLHSNFMGKLKLKTFQQYYTNHFSNGEGKVCLTYNPIIIIAKKK